MILSQIYFKLFTTKTIHFQRHTPTNFRRKHYSHLDFEVYLLFSLAQFNDCKISYKNLKAKHDNVIGIITMNSISVSIRSDYLVVITVAIEFTILWNIQIESNEIGIGIECKMWVDRETHAKRMHTFFTC